MNIFEYLSRFIAASVLKFRGPITRFPRTIRRRYPKLGRNQPCRCGSAMKYKRCCWIKDYLANRI